MQSAGLEQPLTKVMLHRTTDQNVWHGMQEPHALSLIRKNGFSVK